MARVLRYCPERLRELVTAATLPLWGMSSINIRGWTYHCPSGQSSWELRRDSWGSHNRHWEATSSLQRRRGLTARPRLRENYELSTRELPKGRREFWHVPSGARRDATEPNPAVSWTKARPYCDSSFPGSGWMAGVAVFFPRQKPAIQTSPLSFRMAGCVALTAKPRDSAKLALCAPQLCEHPRARPTKTNTPRGAC
jgi:hypothetical protein